LFSFGFFLKQESIEFFRARLHSKSKADFDFDPDFDLDVYSLEKFSVFSVTSVTSVVKAFDFVCFSGDSR
jgi:hypothetical protein